MPETRPDPFTAFADALELFAADLAKINEVTRSLLAAFEPEEDQNHKNQSEEPAHE